MTPSSSPPSPPSSAAARPTIVVAALVLGVAVAGRVVPAVTGATTRADSSLTASYQNATYEVEGHRVTLANGASDTEAAPGSASRVITRYTGYEASGDLDGDGAADVAFLLTQSRGGSGTFYYVVAALRTKDGYVGTNAVLLGDRVAPQTTRLQDGNVTVSYAVRRPGEPMTAAPAVGVTKTLALAGGRLAER